MSNKPIIKFADLQLYLQNRNLPLNPNVIAGHTRYFGNSASAESVRRFHRGEISTTSPAFHVIITAIERVEGIEIDFTGSPYDPRLAAEPGTESRPLPNMGETNAIKAKPMKKNRHR